MLDGGTGDDSLFGGRGADVLFGGDGEDVLRGQGGANVMTGGAGADLFAVVNRTPIDTVTDFTIGQDLIQAATGRSYDVEATDDGVLLTWRNGGVELVGLDVDDDFSAIFA